ncbi:MAG TPA: hemolysin D, partial [Planctomycetaceae bacterium]|nr:hemolysin D [Planctomycetaceae bacterium]
AVQTPLVELANIEHLVCEVEVNVEDAGRVQVGQRANIRSRAFEKPLTGVVTDKNRLVGRPRLRSLDPFAAVDYRTVSAIVALDDPVQAKEWLQLQVEVEIDPAGTTTSN